MGKHYPLLNFTKTDRSNFTKMDQFTLVRSYLNMKLTSKQITARLNIPHNVLVEILRRLRGQLPVEHRPEKQPKLTMEEIAQCKEPVGCRTIYGDVKNDFDWFRCQKPLKKGVRYLFCDDCYGRFVHVKVKKKGVNYDYQVPT